MNCCNLSIDYRLKNLNKVCGYTVSDRHIVWATENVIQCWIENKAYYAVKECDGAGFGFDFMVHPDHRSAQILLDLGKEIHRKCAHLNFIYGFPNQLATTPSKVFLGYRYFYAIELYQENIDYFSFPLGEGEPLPKVDFQWRYSKPDVNYYLVEGSVLKIYQNTVGHILKFGGFLSPVLQFFEQQKVKTVSCWKPNPLSGLTGHPFMLAIMPLKQDPKILWQVEMGDSDVF